MSTYEARKRAWTKYNQSQKKKDSAKKWRDSHKKECYEASIKWQHDNRDRVNELSRERNATENGRMLRIEREKRYAEKHRVKRLAKDAIHNAIKAGKMTRPELCSNCGVVSKIEGHHFDYSKPLEVIWLCETCHTAKHSKR